MPSSDRVRTTSITDNSLLSDELFRARVQRPQDSFATVLYLDITSDGTTLICVTLPSTMGTSLPQMRIDIALLNINSREVQTIVVSGISLRGLCK